MWPMRLLGWLRVLRGGRRDDYDVVVMMMVMMMVMLVMMTVVMMVDPRATLGDTIAKVCIYVCM